MNKTAPAWAGWPWLCAAASGILLVLSLPPFRQGWLAWVALTPLIVAAWWHQPPASPESEQVGRLRRWWRQAWSFRLGYLAGFIFFAGAFHWLAALGALFRNPALYALPVLLALYMAVYFGFWTWFLRRLVRPEAEELSSSLRNLWIGVAGASAWVAAEWIRSWLFSGFSWNMLGVAMVNDVAMIQIAEITGVAGLSWLAAFANIMAVVVVKRIVAELGPTFLKRVRWEFSATMALIAAVFSFGVRTLLAPPAPTKPLKVAVVQPNIPQEVKFHSKEEEEEEQVFRTLMQNNFVAAAQRPDLVVWPEAVTPRGVFADERNRDFVREEAARGDYGLLLGSLEYEQDPETEKWQVYNSALLFTDKGEQAQSFRKMHLVIFGEYLPFRALMPQFIADLIPGDIARGQDYTLLDLPAPEVSIGALVCFEDTSAYVVRGLVKNGAQVLVNITNDGWFLKTAAMEQHLANAQLRAVEARRPLLRGTNTGVSCLVDAYGRVRPLQKAQEPTESLRPHEEGVGLATVSVPQQPKQTFYMRHGDWWAHLSTMLTGGVLGVQAFRRRKARA